MKIIGKNDGIEIKDFDSTKDLLFIELESCSSARAEDAAQYIRHCIDNHKPIVYFGKINFTVIKAKRK